MLVDGELALYVEKGGRTLLAFVDDPAILRTAVIALAAAAATARCGSLAVERVDGEALGDDAPIASALSERGFVHTSKGWLRLRA